MLEVIKINEKRWDWKAQFVWEWETKEQISSIINRVEAWYYKTKKVKLDLTIINLETYTFSCPNIFEFMTHYRLVENANLDYPILINNLWQIIDWRHRLCKAILQGKKNINAIQILDSSII